MAVTTAVPAKPPTFHFKLRLVDSVGSTFSGKEYALWWGGKLASTGLVDDRGVVEVDLDDSFDSGLLDIGETDDQKTFIARWTIPLEVVKPPPPPAPLPPPSQAAPPPKPKPQPQREEWTTENDPEPPLPEWPGYEARPEVQEEYNRQQRAHDAWLRRQEDAKRDAAEWQRKSEREREAREQDQKLRKSWSTDSGAQAPPADTAQGQLSPDEREELQKAIQKHREELHAGDVLRFELAWRLRNLAILPGVGAPAFPIEGLAAVSLLRALHRFAWRRDIGALDMFTIVGQRTSEMIDLLARVKKEHDE